MKRSLWILRVILVGALVSSGCGSGPTSPGNPSNPAQPGNPGQPGSLNLSGTWTGSIQYYVGSCSTETVSVALTQADTAGANGFVFTGHFETPCGGPVQINGVLNGRLYGTLIDVNGNERITGTATATDIQIRSLQGYSDGNGGGMAAVNAISLHRN